MPSGVPETTDGGAWAVIGTALTFGGLAVGYFWQGFMRSFRSPERTEERRVVLETAEIADAGGLRGMATKLAEIHPAVLSTNKDVAAALVILEGQERRAEVLREAQKLRDEERRAERGQRPPQS